MFSSSIILTSYLNLFLHASLSLLLTLSLSLLNIPSLSLYALHTYIHPDDVSPYNSNTRAAIRRPGAPEAELRPRKKTKQNFEFDENKAQIFRLKLSHAHLHSRLHFDQFHKAFSSTFVALFSLVLHMFLKVDKDHRILQNSTIVPVLLCFVGVFRVCVVVFLVSFEQSASKRLDKQCSVMLGILGFVVGVLFVLDVFPKWAFDFRLEFLDGFGKLVVSVTMGGLAGLLYMPAARNARAFWLGTDQSRSYLSIISCGWIERLLLYGSSLLAVFTALLWVSPFANLLVNKNNTSGRKGLGADELVGNVGMSSSDFDKFRQLCLLVVGILQMLTLRTNVQIFLNEAVLSWYQRLHASKVPDLDFSRAKVFLHNHYLCLVALQFFAPPALAKRIRGSQVRNK
ncbi:uncharacterized protein LOC141720692 isoform X2 [Apium graveolens]|uniref:uncharacterized protein LOC141720692 isoform X2 n=1 Tax=Apium graveolens TaxID=4045 RepID=UPI003D79EF85